MIEQFEEICEQWTARNRQLLELAGQLHSRIQHGDPAIDSSPFAVFVKDRTRHFTYRNGSLTVRPGVNGENTPSESLAPSLAQLTDEFVFRTGQMISLAHSHPGPGGDLFARTFKFPLRSASGEVEALLGVTIPIHRPSDGSTAPAEIVVEDELIYVGVSPALWSEIGEAHAKLLQLSSRQKSVVSMISAGLKQEAISRRLDISRKTVEKHREAASKKLDARSYAELIRIATLGQFIEPMDVPPLAQDGVPETVSDAAEPEAD